MTINKYGLPLNLLELYKFPSINHVSGFCDVTNQLDPKDLVRAYHRARESAPHRHERQPPKQYFVGHSGVTSSGGSSNRREEHLAVALWNATQKGVLLKMPGSSTLNLLDYQVPLKARRGDKGIGKVDLVGLIDGAQICVIELKIHPVNKACGDTPLRAFLEALAYCAIVEANADDIAKEVLGNTGLAISKSCPDLVVMAPEEYWSGFVNHEKTGDWWPALLNLADQLEGSLGLKSHFIALRNSGFNMGLNGEKPQLIEDCSLNCVSDLF